MHWNNSIIIKSHFMKCFLNKALARSICKQCTQDSPKVKLWFKFDVHSKEFSINSSIDIEISNEKLDLWKDKIILLKNKRKKGRIAHWWGTWSKLERQGFRRNELGLSNRIPVFTQRFPGSARSKCCKLLKRNIYMAKKCFDVRINDFGDWSSLFGNFLWEVDLGKNLWA